MSDMRSVVPFYSMRGLVKFLQQQGLAETEILQNLGCEAEALSQQLVPFTIGDYYQLYEFAMAKLGKSNLGFLHGKTLFLGQWGILGHIVMASENLSQALFYQKRYQSLTSVLGHAYHEENGSETTMRWLSSPDTPTYIIEQVVTAWIAFAFEHTLSEQKPKSVHFVHSEHDHIEQYESFFGCEVIFNSSFNGVVIRTESLSLPLINHNKEILSLLCNHAEVQLTEHKALASLTIIREYLVDQLPTKVPSLTNVAEHLGISVRQLQRKFQKEQTNLTELLEIVRRNLAIAYLTQTDHKISYIATMLGYSEQSAFQRAFKRWTDTTPQSFRLNPTAVNVKHN